MQKVGKLTPNRIPTHRWEVISVDTIRELPESKGYNAILVAVDRLSKCIHAVPTITMVDSTGVAHLFLEHVWRHHRLLEAIISDRGSAFVSNFSRELATLLDIQLTPSTAYHLQMDRQMEQVNQEIEAYLQVFVSHHQDDWADWLPLAEFAYNNHVHSATHCTPFELDSGQHPQMGSEPTRCRQDNGPMCKSPISTSFGPQNTTVIMSQESHYWNAFLIRFTKTHFLHPPNYGYWDVSYIVGKVWIRRLQRRWNRRKRFSNDGVIPRISLSRWILRGGLILGVCLGLLEGWNCDVRMPRMLPLNGCQKGEGRSHWKYVWRFQESQVNIGLLRKIPISPLPDIEFWTNLVSTESYHRGLSNAT